MFFSASFHCHCIHLPLFWLLPRFQPFQARPKEKNELVYGCSNSGQSYFLTSKLLSGQLLQLSGTLGLGQLLQTLYYRSLHATKNKHCTSGSHGDSLTRYKCIAAPRSIVISIICSKLPREPLYLDRTLMTFQLA